MDYASIDTCLRGYEEVLSALRHPVLSASCGQFQESIGTLVWPGGLDNLARVLFEGLPYDRPLELMSELAHPFSRAVAAAVTGAADIDLDRLQAFAWQVFESNCGDATVELARSFAGPGVALKVQAFVALTHTLPGFLGNAWLALLQAPEQMTLLRREPELLPHAIEELLRFAGPSETVYRSRGDSRIALMLAQANRDATKFPEPDRLDIRRNNGGHLAFGAGQHACAGAAIIRKATTVVMPLFVDRFAEAKLLGEPEYRMTHPIRVLQSLRVGPGGRL